MAIEPTNILCDMTAEEVVGFQVGAQANGRNCVWLCVDGQCVLRVTGAKMVEITDLRSRRIPTKQERRAMKINAAAEHRRILREGVSATSGT